MIQAAVRTTRTRTPPNHDPTHTTPRQPSRFPASLRDFPPATSPTERTAPPPRPRAMATSVPNGRAICKARRLRSLRFGGLVSTIPSQAQDWSVSRIRSLAGLGHSASKPRRTRVRCLECPQGVQLAWAKQGLRPHFSPSRNAHQKRLMPNFFRTSLSPPRTA